MNLIISKSTISVLIFFIFSQSLFAIDVTNIQLDSLLSDRKGNGGDVIVCKDNDGLIKNVELLDIYEANTLYSFLIHNNQNLSVNDILNSILNRLSHLESSIYIDLLENINNFNDEAQYVPHSTFVNIDDSNHLFIPKNCAIEQIAIQQPPSFDGQARYFINLELWNRLDNLNKSALILHEVLYKKAIEKIQINNSKIVRFFVGLIFSDSYFDMSNNELNNSFKKYFHLSESDLPAHYKLQKLIQTKKFSLTEVVNNIPTTIKWDFRENGVAKAQLTCFFSQSKIISRLNEDVSISLESLVIIDNDQIHFQEAIFETKNTSDGIERCNLFTRVEKQQITYLSSSKVIINGKVYNVENQ